MSGKGHDSGGNLRWLLTYADMITLLLAPIGALRLLQRVLPRKNAHPETAFIVPPAPVNVLLTWLLWLESRWALRWKLPVGVSLMAVARKG